MGQIGITIGKVLAIFWDHWRLRNLIRDLRCKSYEIYRFSMMFIDFHEQKGKSLRLQNSSKRPQNPSKRPQKQSNGYKSQKHPKTRSIMVFTIPEDLLQNMIFT